MAEEANFLTKGRERAASDSNEGDVIELVIEGDGDVDVDFSKDGSPVDHSFAAWKAGEEKRIAVQMVRPDLEDKKLETKFKNNKCKKDKPKTTQVEYEKKGRSSFTAKVLKFAVVVATFVHFVSPINISEKAEAPIADLKQSVTDFIQAKKEIFGLESGNFYRVACATVAQKNLNLGVITNGYAVTADLFRKKMEREGTNFKHMDESLTGIEITDKTAEACAVSFSTQENCGKKLMRLGGKAGLLVQIL